MSNLNSVITKIRFREDSAANWKNVNPVLDSGEPGRETDTGFFKLGDGVNDWNSLPYQIANQVTVPEAPSDSKVYGRKKNKGEVTGEWVDLNLAQYTTEQDVNDMLASYVKSNQYASAEKAGLVRISFDEETGTLDIFTE